MILKTPRRRRPGASAGAGRRAAGQDAQLAQIKRALAGMIVERRRERKVTQARLARLLGSSQSRVSRLEAADPAASLGLLVRALLATGATRRDIARAIEGR